MSPTPGADTSAPQALTDALLGQGSRQIQLTTGLPAADLVVERYTVTEAVSQPFLIEIDCLSTSAHLDTAELARQEITLRQMLADGSYRAWHGFVVDCASLGGDGGLARYRLTAAPWIARLRARVDCFVYQDKTALEIIEDLFKDYDVASYQNAVSQTLRKRSICAQYRESDLDFMQRLLAEEGLSYRFEHEQDGDGGHAQQDAQARHKLVIFDARTTAPDCAQSSIRFHRADITETEDSITRWSSSCAVGTNAVSLASWDYKQLTATGAQASAEPVGKLPSLESYTARGAYRFNDTDSAAAVATLRLQAEELDHLRYHGTSTVRALGEGQRFTLTEHFGNGDNRFVTLWVRHEATNNLATDIGSLLDSTRDEDISGYRNTFEAVQASTPIVPRHLPRPTAPEGQTAIVIAEGETPLQTDRDHRVRVRFPWLRAPERGNLNAPDASDVTQVTAWVRVAGAVAGPNWGAHHLPRVGTEVLLTFLDGDIDRPLAAMQLHNEQDNPPWPAAEAGIGHALSGWHSQGMGGDGYNQWVVDDTPGQLRMRMASSTADTQLNLGYLVSQNPQDANRGAWRGNGAELRSDAWAVVRAGEGMLLSTTAQPRAAGAALDVSEALGQLKAAQQTARRLSDAARAQAALPLAANEHFDALQKAIDPTQDGKYRDTVNGQKAAKPDGAPVDRFAVPLLVTEAPTAIAMTTPMTTTVYAGRHLHCTTQSDWHLASDSVTAIAAAQGVSLFAQRQDLQAVAANGPFSLQAHADAMEILADKQVSVTSSNDSVEILAQQKVVLHGGSSIITLDGGQITFETQGLLDVKGAGHPFSGGGGRAAALPALPTGSTEMTHWIEVNHRDMEGEPFVGQNYKIHFEDGQVVSGKLDAAGHARHENVPPRAVRVEYELPEPGNDQPWDQVSKLIQASRSKLG
ncbi:type VI secretion system Vgr family protein [Cupriavidus pauculus]|jgi:type VI secretion system secreted protein VgrG|uniref:type VI secretion system Vgr family protein n=1 Tax=Cupriavidus pauculus TaxID=82633 RepID=UPI0030F6D3EB